MATHLSSITGIGSSAKKLAALLQKKAPPGEKLAFINDREAALLKRHGGSGKEVEDTGIKSYDDTEGFDLQPTNIATGEPSPTPFSSEPVTNVQAGGGDIGGISNAPAEVSGGNAAQGFTKATGGGLGFSPASVQAAAPSAPTTNYALNAPSTAQAADIYGLTSATGAPQSAISPDITQAATQPQQPAQPKTGLFGDAAKTLGLTSDQLGRGLGGGLQALLAANQMRQARAQGQQVKQETQALATPYQQQGQQLQAQANAGTLTPANQQALQAAQAQMAQRVSSMGGVGVAQMQTQIANLTNNLLQQQMNFGLQLQQVGDKIAQGAIQAGAQADQYVNSLTASYAQNIARTVFNTPYVVGGSNP